MANKQDYLARKEQNKQKRISAGVLSECFPKVSKIVINMKYYQSLSDRVYMVRTINFFPSSHAYFHMECLTKECLNGGFEFSPVIKDLVKKKKKTSKGKLMCKGKNDSLVKGHISVSYEINIRYSRNSR